MCQRKRYFTLINRKGQIKFTGTADDAVTKGISVSQSAFRMVVQTFVDGKLLKTSYPYDENYQKNLEVTQCFLCAGCKMYYPGSETPCCFECAFRDGCYEHCKIDQRSVGAIYNEKS